MILFPIKRISQKIKKKNKKKIKINCVCAHVDDSLQQFAYLSASLSLSVFFHFFISRPLCCCCCSSSSFPPPYIIPSSSSPPPFLLSFQAFFISTVFFSPESRPERR